MQHSEIACSNLARAIDYPALLAHLANQLAPLEAGGRVKLVLPENNSIGAHPRWLVTTPVRPEDLVTLVGVGTSLISADAPAAPARYGVDLLMNLMNAGLAEVDKAMVRQRLVQATLDRLASAKGLLSFPQWLPVLCEALSQPMSNPVDRPACETMLKHWMRAWGKDEQMCVEPCLVVDALRQVLVARRDVQRTQKDNATLVFFVEALFQGAIKRDAGSEAEWALRALHQWPGGAARLAFARCTAQMPIPEALKHIKVLDGQRHFQGADCNAPIVVDKNAPELFLQLLRLANYPLRTRVLLRLARQQGQVGPPLRTFGPQQGESPAGIVPPRYFHQLAQLLLRDAFDLLCGPLPPLDDVSALVQAGFGYLLRSDELSPTNVQAQKHLKDAVRMLVAFLERLPGHATVALGVQLMCLKVLGRWQADALRLEPDQVLRILRSVDVSETASVPRFVLRMQLRMALHHLYAKVAAHPGHGPDMPEMLEKIAGLHAERFGPDRFDRERSMSGWARKQLEAKKWQLQLLHDPSLLIDLMATPEEQSRVIDSLWAHAQQLSSLAPEACLLSATLLCYYAAQNADTLAPTAWSQSPDRMLDLACICVALLSRALKERPLEATGLFAGAALVLGSPLLEPGPAREQWEGVADLLLEHFEEQRCTVANEVLFHLIEVHDGVDRLGKRTADAIVQLYLGQPEYHPAIVKILQTLAGRDNELAKRARAVLTECLEHYQEVQREHRALELKHKLALKGLEYDWRDITGRSANNPDVGVFLKSGPDPYVEDDHRRHLEEIAKVTPHQEECWRLLKFLASKHSRIGRFHGRGVDAFSVTYGSRLVIRFNTAPLLGNKALRHLAEHLAHHFRLDVLSDIRLSGNVLEVDAMKANAHEVGQCINRLRGVLQILDEMGGQPELLLQYAGSLPYRFLYASADATAYLKPQGVVRLLLDMEGELKVQSPTLDTFFLKNFEWLPCDRADRVLELLTDTKHTEHTRAAMSAPEHLQYGEHIIAALLSVGLTQRAQDAADRLLAVCTTSDLTAPTQQSIAGLPPWQLRARLLLLRLQWARLGATGPHVEVFENMFRAMALSTPKDEALHDYLDWAQSIALAHPAEIPRLLNNLPAPRTWQDIFRRREMAWRELDELGWRSVTWSLAAFDGHDTNASLSLNGRPVLFRMPFHSALVAKIKSRLNEAEVIELCVVHSRHLEPAQVPRVGAAVRIWFEKLISMRREEPELPRPSHLLSEDILRGLLNEPSLPVDARDTLEQMLADVQKLTGSPLEKLLQGLPHLIPPFLQANAREALEWTLAMAQLLVDRYPDVAAKLLNQVPSDARAMKPEWESLAMRVQGLPLEAPPAKGLPVLLLKDVLLPPTNSFRNLRVPVGLAVDSLGVVTQTDPNAVSCVEYGILLAEYINQIQEAERFGIASLHRERATLVSRCLQDVETAVGLLLQVQCREPLGLIRYILQSREARILQLIGIGRIGSLVNPHDAPDFCGVRARWQLPLDLKQNEAECVCAFCELLIRSFEPAGMSLLQLLVSHESLDTDGRGLLVNRIFKLWDITNAAPNGTDGAWAGMLLVIEHRDLLEDGRTKERAVEVRTTLLRRWLAGSSDMPALAAMALIRPHENTSAQKTQEILPILEALYSRSRGQPEAARLALWVMRRLHHLDGKEARQLESRLRSEGALPLLDDAKTIVEELLRTFGVNDPTKHQRGPWYAETNHLIGLWSRCVDNPADGVKALLGITRYSPHATAAAAASARLAWTLPGEDPDWRSLAEKWLAMFNRNDRKSPYWADVAHALLSKFQKERQTSFWPDEWEVAATLALVGLTAMEGQHPEPALARYLADALEDVSMRNPSALASDGGRRAIQLCKKWRVPCPAWYQILLPVTRAALQRAIEGADHPLDKEICRTRLAELKPHS